MRRVEAESIGDVWRRTIEEENMTTRLLETRACMLWARVVGDPIAQRSGKPKMSKGIMTVSVHSAPLRSDLNMSRSSIVRLLNKALGRDVVCDIRFIE